MPNSKFTVGDIVGADTKYDLLHIIRILVGFIKSPYIFLNVPDFCTTLGNVDDLPSPEAQIVYTNIFGHRCTKEGGGLPILGQCCSRGSPVIDRR